MVYEAARQYHEAGLSLVNLYPIIDGVTCECGNPECVAVGKHPQNSNWQNTLNTSNAFDCIENYHTYDMHCTGFGFLLDDHHLVVDVDPKNGGFESFEKLAEKVPELKECAVSVKTGGGGFHLYYNKPADFNVVGTHKEYPGIDFKHRGGFVVAAGSLHASGNRYELELDYDGTLSTFDDAPNDLLVIIEKITSHAEHEGDFEGDLVALVSFIPNNDEDYDYFIEMGMAIHDTDPNAFHVWDNWAAKSEKYDHSSMVKKWDSFGDSLTKVTAGTLIKRAMDYGYRPPAKGGTEVIIPDDHIADNDLDVSDIDVLQPHGLVGDIVQHMNDTAFRERPMIAVMASIWAVSSAMGRYYRTPDGAMVNLITMCIAASGSGKDNPYQVAKKMLIDAGMGSAVYPEMASAQDMLKSIFEHQSAFYVMDEAHKIFGEIDGRNTPTYLKQVGATILNLSTEKLLTMRSQDAAKFQESVQKKIAKLEAIGDDTKAEEMWKVIGEIEWNKKKLDYCKKGLNNPFLSIYATSTPAKLDGMVSEDTLSSGLMGRTLLAKEHEDFPKAKGYGFGAVSNNKPVSSNLQGRFNNIVQRGRSQDKTMTWREDYGLEFWGEPIQILASDEAVKLSQKIAAYFDAKAMHETTNPTMQPVWARGFQMVAKVASIMSVERAEISVTDLKYAFKLIQSDINTKTGLSIQGNGQAKDATPEERGGALVARLIHICDVKGGLSPSQIKAKTKKFPDNDVKEHLDSLVKQGSISRTEKEWNGRTSVKFATVKNNFI